MSTLPFKANVKVNIYRGSNVGVPTPTGGAAIQNLDAHFCEAVGGEASRAENLNYTHIIDLPKGTDVRDAYASQHGDYSAAQADTVGVIDRNGDRVYYRVVMVKNVYRGTRFELTRVYLDRMTNNNWQSDAL